MGQMGTCFFIFTCMFRCLALLLLTLLFSAPACLSKHITPRNNMDGPAAKKQKGLTQYDKLAAVTKIVADTGEIAQIKKFAPTDATTNPSLIFKAASAPEHQNLVEDALAYGKALTGACVDTCVCVSLCAGRVGVGRIVNAVGAPEGVHHVRRVYSRIIPIQIILAHRRAVHLMHVKVDGTTQHRDTNIV